MLWAGEWRGLSTGSPSPDVAAGVTGQVHVQGRVGEKMAGARVHGRKSPPLLSSPPLPSPHLTSPY